MERLYDHIPRGIRNNNPGNIRSVPAMLWYGERLPSDDGYARFNTSHNGIRAMLINLYHYYALDGCITYADGCKRWAPRNENDTAKYTADICGKLNVAATDVVPYTHEFCVVEFAKAIIWMENGQMSYTEAELYAAAIDAGCWK